MNGRGPSGGSGSRGLGGLGGRGPGPSPSGGRGGRRGDGGSDRRRKKNVVKKSQPAAPKPIEKQEAVEPAGREGFFSATQDAQAQKKRRKGTILTSGLGLLGDAPTSRKSLLGG
mgnify:CR=1 FL=1